MCSSSICFQFLLPWRMKITENEEGVRKRRFIETLGIFQNQRSFWTEKLLKVKCLGFYTPWAVMKNVQGLVKRTVSHHWHLHCCGVSIWRWMCLTVTKSSAFRFIICFWVVGAFVTGLLHQIWVSYVTKSGFESLGSFVSLSAEGYILAIFCLHQSFL